MKCCKNTFCFLCIKGVQLSSTEHDSTPRCPLCRAEVDPTVLEAKLSTADYENKHKQDSMIGGQWKYAGRSGGWWLYDDKTNDELETYYHHFNVQVREFENFIREGGVEEDENEEEEPRRSKKRRRTDNDHDNEDEDEDDGEEDDDYNENGEDAKSNEEIRKETEIRKELELKKASSSSSSSSSSNDESSIKKKKVVKDPKKHLYPVTITHRKYLIDFNKMTQINADDHSKKRKIIRSLKEEVFKEFERGKNRGVKGQAGAQFVRVKSNEKL